MSDTDETLKYNVSLENMNQTLNGSLKLVDGMELKCGVEFGSGSSTIIGDDASIAVSSDIGVTVMEEGAYEPSYNYPIHLSCYPNVNYVVSNVSVSWSDNPSLTTNMRHLYKDQIEKAGSITCNVDVFGFDGQATYFHKTFQFYFLSKCL